MTLRERYAAFKATKIGRVLKFITGMATILLLILASWSLSYLINPYVMNWVGWKQDSYWAFLVLCVMGLLFFVAVLAIIFPFVRVKHVKFYQSILDALKKISQGEFNISIPMYEDFRDEYGSLVDGIQQMADSLGEMEQMRQEFISNVSHEIQSPLTSIRGFARALQSEELSEEERLNYLQIIEMETMRLSKLSENLLKLTSLESEHHPMEMKRYRLDQQLRNIALISEPQWLEKRIELDLNVDKMEITADEEMLSQVWMNLVHNAIKFTPEGGAIHIEARMSNGTVEVCITDSGIGIDEEHIPHLFERFFKADVSRNRTIAGNGLGLSIVQKIVQLHSGDIQVSSRKGEGSTFCVKLPLDPNAAESSILEAGSAGLRK
ncbi:HAMP domain-containing histidine kinase [Paenibacillus alvei]|uniref:histidine kinase n=1 Tax=Paenibacillus alvei TaxID=44250 RepID=A0ABT4EGR3_PAEAL|nr:HAMP domain-containing sensor histidine kinase [Paenibacillus alvei]MCY9531633.1 HAMP domain-containing histidine kinase [Paenibacillus alvei]